MNKNNILIICCSVVLAFAGCKKDSVDYRYPKPFDGQQVTLPGVAGTELGVNAANGVFVDFSKGLVTPVTRANWDLGLYPGSDFKVILNHTMGALAVYSGQTSFANVLQADSIKVIESLQLNAAGSAALADPVTGTPTEYLSKLTTIEVGENEASSKIYIVNTGYAGLPPMTTAVPATPTTPLIPSVPLKRPWFKVKVYKGTNGYRIKFAPMSNDNPSFTEFTVNKDLSYNFNFFSFNRPSPIGEPAQSLWDIQWTWTTSNTADGKAIATHDFVLINFLGGVTSSEVMIKDQSAKEYENFDKSKLAGLTYLNTREAIGVKWRSLTPDDRPVVNRDRFYVIKDADGNFYKLRFVSSSNADGGVAGAPVIEYRLVEAAIIPGTT
ncbi:HmuY family protein [Pedobacter cryoconitis]|uniref:Heme-binding HmuY-like protein n=1 Tax=Pedobacter cryoconitis TaxID=188932 RepID=A0A327S8K1_9SPHI|nr:HmuY family protein [Pedobacter cryoconitis]RAJ24314.1 heme-binding HmuY-like protein [Pedobacter cryoconitis]